ncbi:MAG: DUF2313 domain-containing protein [Azonexus sp.]|jgi:uncharacterized protein YmfQ (DUF2313 family)|nr:DUF2313 domain-containing protein [Azonexus sp.]
MNALEYRAQLLALLPPGLAWPRDEDAPLTRQLHALADEFARVDARASALIDEADPRSTTELLTDHERVAGLPDACTGPLATLALRRAALHGRITGIGGQSVAYFTELAAALGYTISITEYRPYRVNSFVNDPLCDPDWHFVWQVNAPLETLRWRTVASPVSEPLAAFGNELLECVIRRFAPAHTLVIFAYQGE